MEQRNLVFQDTLENASEDCNPPLIQTKLCELYMFKEDMISDGIENCVQYIYNFNPEKSQNPFAYFTQIINYAFLRRIQKEKKADGDQELRLLKKVGMR